MKPESQVVLITGATSGIGRATAGLLARHGYTVFGVSRRPQVNSIPGVTLLPIDVTSDDSVRAGVSQVLSSAGRIDALINNAGILGPSAAWEELSVEQLRAVFEANFVGMVRMIQAVLPDMRRLRQGRIVNVGSIAGLVSFYPFFGPYAASKHAITAFTESLRYEVEPLGIQVSLVAPGFYRTGLAAGMERPSRPVDDYGPEREVMAAFDRFAVENGRDPEKVALTIFHILNAPRPRARYIVGLDARVMLGMKRYLPQSAEEEVVRGVIYAGKGRPRWQWRALLDSRIADRLALSLLSGLGAAAGWGVWNWVRKRRS